MRLQEFLNLMGENWQLYLFSIALSFIILLPIYRKYVRAIIDPFFIVLFGSICANAVPIFLFL